MGEFRSLAAFMHGEDRRWFSGKTLALPVTSDGKEARRSPCGADKAYFWVYDTLAAEIMPEEKFAREHAGLSLEIPGLADGPCKVEYWSTASGRCIRTECAFVEGNRLSLNLPAFNVDLAGRIRRSSP